MAMARVENFPDTTGCKHSGIGLVTPPARRTGNVEVGYCPDCRFEIAFILDKDGTRTGETRIVQIAEVNEESQSPPTKAS
jgi:hypothetical protein